MNTNHKTSNGEIIQIGDTLNTRTLKKIVVLNYSEVLFIKNNKVYIEHINMLNQHRDIKKEEYEAPEIYVMNRIKSNEVNKY